MVLHPHPIAKAVRVAEPSCRSRYALREWAKFNVFASDGAVPIDDNISEREMKRIGLNCKASLFSGREHISESVEIQASFTRTCCRHVVDVHRCLTQLLANLPDAPISTLDDWLRDR